MRSLRIFYIVVLILTVGLTLFFYWQYRLKDKELAQYKHVSKVSTEMVIDITDKLEKTKNELMDALQQMEELNRSITALESEKLGFQGELLALKEEREREIKSLQDKIDQLAQEKALWEQRFRSLRELERAIRIAKIDKRKGAKAERARIRATKIQMLKSLDEIALQQGNRGYVVVDGSSTFKPRTRVKVDLEPIERLP